MPTLMALSAFPSLRKAILTWSLHLRLKNAPIRRMRLPCCACASIDQPALAPIAARKSRRRMSDPPRWFSGAYRGQRCVGTGSSGRFVLPCVGPFLAQGCLDPAAPFGSAYWGAPAAHSRARAVVGVAESDLVDRARARHRS